MKKIRTLTLPPLHPATAAALGGRFTVPEGTHSGTVESIDHSAVYQATNVSAALVEAVAAIRHCKAIPALQERYLEAVATLGRVAAVAVAVDDEAFPEQLGFAMRCARDPAVPRRRAIFRAWQHMTSGTSFRDHLTGATVVLTEPQKFELHNLSEGIFGAQIPPRTFDDELVKMNLTGYQKRPRGKPPNSRVKIV